MRSLYVCMSDIQVVVDAHARPAMRARAFRVRALQDQTTAPHMQQNEFCAWHEGCSKPRGRVKEQRKLHLIHGKGVSVARSAFSVLHDTVQPSSQGVAILGHTWQAGQFYKELMKSYCTWSENGRVARDPSGM